MHSLLQYDEMCKKQKVGLNYTLACTLSRLHIGGL